MVTPESWAGKRPRRGRASARDPENEIIGLHLKHDGRGTQPYVVTAQDLNSIVQKMSEHVAQNLVAALKNEKGRAIDEVKEDYEEAIRFFGKDESSPRIDAVHRVVKSALSQTLRDGKELPTRPPEVKGWLAKAAVRMDNAAMRQDTELSPIAPKIEHFVARMMGDYAKIVDEEMQRAQTIQIAQTPIVRA